jgi:hypothetical protein
LLSPLFEGGLGGGALVNQTPKKTHHYPCQKAKFCALTMTALML